MRMPYGHIKYYQSAKVFFTLKKYVSWRSRSTTARRDRDLDGMSGQAYITTPGTSG
jgi:hypothetical protein